MKYLQKPLPGTPVYALAPVIRDLVDNVNQFAQIRGSNGIKVDTSHGGVIVSYVGPSNAPVSAATSSPESSGEVILEMHQEWEATRQYRVNERVVAEPASGGVSGYYSVFQCLDSSAGSGDIPGSSAKWQSLTTAASAWSSGSTYSEGATAMHGTTPGQYKLYTASAATSAGEEPGVSAKWTYLRDVLLGLKAWPLSGTVRVPFRKYTVADIRWELPNLIFCYSSETFDRNGKLIASHIDSDYVTWAKAESCPPSGT